MSDSEKWARWALGVVFLTIGAYGAFFIFLGHGPATSSVFALLALTAVPASSRRHLRGRAFDEREREIARKAWRASFSTVWLMFIGLMSLVPSLSSPCNCCGRWGRSGDRCPTGRQTRLLSYTSRSC